MENVGNYLQIIEHDPLARREPVNRGSGYFVVGFEPILYLAGDCFQMRLGCRRTDHKKISERRDAAEIEDHDLFRFLV